jgi:hypothetical protein
MLITFKQFIVMQMLIPRIKNKLLLPGYLTKLWQTTMLAVMIIAQSSFTDAMALKSTPLMSAKVAASNTVLDGLTVSVPSSLSICEGGTVSVSAANISVTGGSPPYNYQWYAAGVPVAGANTAALSIAAPPLGIHTYTLQVSDNFGNTGSDQLVITTTCQPHIAINNPDPVCLNTPLSISTVVVSSSTLLSYQWYANGSPIVGATNQTLNLPNPPVGNTAYSVVVTEAAGCSDSDNTVLTVYPNIGVNIDAPAACVGSSFELTPAISNGMPPYTYQWAHNGSTIGGATGATLNIASATAGSHTYSLSVTDANGCPGSGAVTFSVGAPPTVNAPNPTPTCAATAVTVAATASGGTGLLSYQWYLGDMIIPGANSLTYTIAAPAVGTTSYIFVATDSNGCQSSDETVVTVYANPSVNLPDPATACAGGSATLSAIASNGTSPYAYQWQQNGANISGSSSTLNVSTPAVGSNIYTVRITDAHGCTATDNATVAATVGISVSIEPTAICESAPTMAINSSHINIVGGSQPYAYQWYFAGSPIAGATSLTLTQPTPLAGVYNYVLQVTDATGCTGADEATVAVNPTPQITLSQPAASCEGSPISITSTIICSSQPLYQWFIDGTIISGQTSPNLYWENPPVGTHTYTLQVISENSCIGQASVSVTIYPAPQLNLSASGGACAGSTASVSVNVSSGSAPYSYQWYMNGAIIASAVLPTYTINSAIAGNNVYTVVVSDANGCTATESITVETGNPPTVSIDNPAEICYGSSATLNGSAMGGVAPYTYQWYAGSNMIPGANNASYTATSPALGTTNYTLMVTDSNGCIDETTVVLTVNPNPTVDAPDVSGCNASNILLTSSATGGSSPYNYQWYQGGAPVSGGNSANINVSAPASGTATYMVSVSDANGCTDTDNAIVSTTNIVLSVPDPMPICYGTSVTIGNANISGGSLPYSFQWTQNGNPIAGANSINLTIPNPAVGTHTYILNVTDANGCTGSDGATITVNATPTVSVYSPLPQCAGSGTMTLTANVSGASGVTYQWYNGGSPMSGQNGATLSLSNPAIGTTSYTVVVTASGGCTANAVGNITVYPQPTVNINSTGGTCSGDPATLTANVSSGTPNYAYQWYADGAPIAGAVNATLNINSAVGTVNYSVSVTDANGCVGSDIIIVSVGTPPSVNVPNPATVCAGQSATLMGAVSGGTAPYSYQWYTGGMPIFGANDATYMVANPTTGSTAYTLIVTDANGCTAQDDATLTAYPAVNFNLSAPTSVCVGSSVTIAANITSGSPEFTYQWSENGNIIAGANSAGYTVASISAGSHTYTLLVTDANGCTKTKNVTVNVGTAPTITAPNPMPLCASSSVNLTSTLVGGTAPFYYQWYLGDVAVVGGASQNITVSNPPTGNTTYTVIVTDSNGCTASDNATVTVSSTMYVNLPQPATICQGQSTTLTVNVSGGAMPYSYQWWFNGNLISGANVASFSVNNPPVGNATYSVQVMDGNGCIGEASATVSVVAQPSVSIAPVAPICGSSPITLTANISNGNGLPIQWYANGNIIVSATSATLNIANPATGTTTYSINVGGTSTCAASDDVTVTVYSVPTVSIAPVPSVCEGQNVTISANASGGTPSYSYAWQHNGMSAGNGASISPSDLASGSHTYSVTVTDTHGCTASSSTTFTINAQPTISITPIAPACAGSSMSLTATTNGAWAIQWYVNGSPINGATSLTLNVPSTTSGTYTYSVTASGSGSNCSDSAETTVTIYSTPSVSITPVPSVCEGQNVTISANASGGTPSYSYAWQHNGMSAGNSASISPSDLASGSHTYSVTVTDTHGCTASSSTTFTINAQPTISITPIAPACAGSSMSLTATTNGAWAIQWYVNGSPISGATSLTLNVPSTTSGTYTYSVTASGSGSNCSDSAETTVTIYSTPSVSIAPVPSVCEGQNVTISANALGGTPSYSYAWQHNGMSAGNSASISPSDLASGSHTYSVTVTDTHGCTASSSTTFTINPQPTISITPIAPACAGSSMNLTATTNGAWAIQWYVNGSPISGATSLTLNVPSTTSGTYTYSVTASGSGSNCSDSAETTVTIYSNPSVTIAPTAPVCEGESVTMNASASGGSGSYSYQWQHNGAAISGATSSSYTATGLSVGNHSYTVLVTDSNGCTADAEATATVTAQPTVSITDPAPVCSGSAVMLTATASGASVSYQWYANGTAVAGATNSTYNVTSPSVGSTTYSVVVTSSAGCTASDMTTLTIYPVPSVTVNNATAVCAGSASSLSGNATGGTAPYSYQWYVGGSAIAGETSSTLNISSPSVGNTVYTLVVTDAHGCTTQDDGSILVNPSLNINISPIAALCEGAMATTTATVTGGTAPFTYQWYQGATALAGQTSATLNINAPVGNTVYTLVVTDAANCSGTETVTTTVYAQPEVSISGTNQICGGACAEATLTANVTPITPNPSGSYIYIWSNGATTQSISVTPGTTSTYSVTVSIAGLSSCAASDSHTITVSSLSVNLSDESICEGSSATLLPVVSGATGAVSYAWSNGATAQSITVSPTTTMPYAVSVSDASGCSGFDSGTVTVGRLVQANAGADLLTCAGSSNATIGASAISGASYSWSNGDNSAQINVSPMATTTYTLTVSNVCGTTTDQVTVVVGSVIADAGGDRMTCAGSSVTLTASGGTTYAWSNGGSTAQISVSPTATTTYTVTVSDANGCSDTDAVTVAVNALSAVGAVQIEANCNGSTAECMELQAVSNAGSIVNYIWSTGDTEPNITVSGTGGTYSVTVTDAFGCTASATINDPCGTPPSPVDANNDTAETTENVAVLINVLGNDDGTGIFISSVTSPANGTAIVQGNNIQYTPNTGFVGTDVFTYQICNAAGSCDVATVTVIVTDGTTPPPCENISYHCVEPITPLQVCPTFCGLSGDYTITDADATYLCSISVQNNGTCIRYISLPLYTGVDTVHVYAEDQFGNTDVATLIIQVGDCDTWTGGGSGGNGGIIGGNGIGILEPIGGTVKIPITGGIGGKTSPTDTNTDNAIAISAITPVPATDVLNVRFMGKEGKTTLTVYSVTGVLLHQTALESGEGMNFYRFEVKQFPAGAYLLQLSNNSGTATAKFVKQ